MPGQPHLIPNLPPLPHPVALFPAFIAPQPTGLVLKEKYSLSGDDFEIKSVDGKSMFRVEGKAFSLSGRKVFCDASGREMMHIRKEHLTLRPTYYAEDPSSSKHELFSVKSKFQFGGSKQICEFTGYDNTPHRLVIRGDWFDSEAQVIDEISGVLVAQIDRKFFNSREFFLGAQTYLVTAAPGADLALVAALCICLDEARNDKK